MDFLRVRRRRLSLERLPVDEVSVPTRSSCKVVVLGDEASSGKIGILELLCLETSGTGDSAVDMLQGSSAEFLPMDIRELAFRIHGAAPPATAAEAVDRELELWAPICTEQYAALRPLYYSGTDVFVIVFSIAEPHMLEAVHRIWQREVEPLQSQLEHPVPVLLVGNFGELRQQPDVPRELVAPKQAVQLAQQCGFFKYLEITSFNPAHIHELFRQAVLAAQDTGGENGACDTIERNRETMAVRSVLRAPRPSGSFDPWERAFRLDLTSYESSGVQYLVSWDGNPPTDRSHRYKGKLVMRHPYPKVIQVQSVTRCKYRSEICCFPVPGETCCPVGHFDACANRLVFDTRDQVDVRYFYTLDGSGPTAESESCGRDWPVVDLATQPNVVKVVALASGRLVSAVVSFPLPAVLPPPDIRLVACADGMTQELKIAVQRGVHYKYTTDGTDPSFSNGRSYTGPVTVSTAVHPVKAIALPIGVMPSTIAVAMKEP
jgi:GTPase SAR1 family protein